MKPGMLEDRYDDNWATRRWHAERSRLGWLLSTSAEPSAEVVAGWNALILMRMTAAMSIVGEVRRLPWDPDDPAVLPADARLELDGLLEELDELHEDVC